MRVGLFGGTFDPPHFGHLAVAKAAAHAFTLHRVLLAPTARQPLKAASADAAFADRLDMVGLLCKEHVALEASTLDGPLPDGSPNYTIDTLRLLRSTLSSTDSIFTVVGADAFRNIRQWRDSTALLAEAEWIVVSRPGFLLEDFQPLQLSSDERARVHLLNNVAIPISATEIRARLQNGLDCTEWVPADVLAYIEEHKLYRPA